MADTAKWDVVPTPRSSSSPNNLKPRRIITGLPLGAPCPLPHCAGSPINMCSSTYPSECEECVTECNVETCGLSTEEDRCTDRCVVVPCEDPCLDSCGTCTTSLSAICESGQCQGFEDFVSLGSPETPYGQPADHPRLDSCADLSYLVSAYSNPPNYAPMLLGHDTAQFPDWNNATLSRELDALVCACHTQSLPHSFDCNSCDPSLLSVNKSHPYHHHQRSLPLSSSVPVSGQGSPVVSTPLSPMLTSSGSSRSTPDPLPAVTPRSQPPAPATAPELASPCNLEHQQQHPETMYCLWAGCGKLFDSSQDLVTHVNTAHLLLPLAHEGFQSRRLPLYQQPSSYNNGRATFQDMNSFSCLWDNCNLYPTPSQVPGPSTGNVMDAAKSLLACHVQQDHLGIPVPQQWIPKHYGPNSAPLEGDRTLTDVSHVSRPISDVCTPPSAPTQDNCASGTDPPSPPSQYLCKWRSCALAAVPFSSAADLTTHITDVHVGVGNSRYHCMWEGCNRNGDSGFSSKQKILRHVQSHTGYRPFKCEICEQYFSEAATLQQHMRRHTKEKPYICDFPGCNKAFAITGALTIHRRVHSGNKPFKCTYCDRSFSESSNLSKHVRTHTGDRPYACTYPGCEKRFARPDQIARHKNVHTKTKKTGRIGSMGARTEEGMDIEDYSRP